MSSRRVTKWTTNQNELNPAEGDLIEINRIVYRHWGMYITDGKIIHLEIINNTTEYILNLKFDELVPAVVKYEPLKTVAESSEFRINNKPEFPKNPLPTEERQRLVKTCLERPTDLEYSLKYFNCEHFVTFLKFGLTHSDQMNAGNQFLFTFALNAGVNYLKGMSSEKSENVNALSPLVKAFSDAARNEVYKKPTIEERIERNLIRLFETNN